MKDTEILETIHEYRDAINRVFQLEQLIVAHHATTVWAHGPSEEQKRQEEARLFEMLGPQLSKHLFRQRLIELHAESARR